MINIYTYIYIYVFFFSLIIMLQKSVHKGDNEY